jgi:DNA end-binding protein Ku
VELGFPLQSLKSVKVSSRELDMALRLVEDMSEDWEPGKYRDTYRDDLLKRIEQKVKAGQTEEITEPGEQAQAAAGGADVIDLMALLKKSVARKADRRQEKPRRPRKRRAA